MQCIDVAIVGGGPIGIELAAALKRAGHSYLHFEARQIGHTMSWWAPGTRFFSSNERIAIAGIPLLTPSGEKATREEYLAYLRQVVCTFDLKVHNYEPVVAISGTQGAFTVTTEKAGQRNTYQAANVVLAIGGTERPRKLGIPGEDLSHVSGYFKDPHTYFDTDLLVIGGRNGAIEAALRAHHAGARVAISYRRAEFPEKTIKYWVWPEFIALVKQGRIRGLVNTQPVRIYPRSVELRHADGTVTTHHADFVLSMIGYEADLSLAATAGVAVDPVDQSIPFDPVTMQTNVPGIYLAGTATGGTQSRYLVFLENCHVHVDRIMASLAGAQCKIETPQFAQPES